MEKYSEKIWNYLQANECPKYYNYMKRILCLSILSVFKKQPSKGVKNLYLLYDSISDQILNKSKQST